MHSRLTVTPPGVMVFFQGAPQKIKVAPATPKKGATFDFLLQSLVRTPVCGYFFHELRPVAAAAAAAVFVKKSP